MKDTIITYLLEKAKRGEPFDRFECELARVVWERFDDVPDWISIPAGAASVNEAGWPIDLACLILSDLEWEESHVSN